MRHKLLYADFGILDWYPCHMKNYSSINKSIYYMFEI